LKKQYVIIGLGAAGATAASALRTLDPESSITVLNGEGQPFYLRLDLATILEGKDPQKLIAREDSYWTENNISVLSSRAIGLDTEQKRVFLSQGDPVHYDSLLIAVGAQAQRLTCPGHDLQGIFTYRTLQDANAIHALRDQVKKAVVIGGGILGMEIAKAASDYGWDTTLLVRGAHVGAPLIDADAGAFVHARLERTGVNIIYQDEVETYQGREWIESVITREGNTLACDIVIECIGVAPDLEFLKDTGIVKEGRIAIDSTLRTALPDVFAAGDAAAVTTVDGNTVRCHTWSVAVAQAKVAAENMAGTEAQWSEGVAYNADSFFDQEFAMIGPWDRRHEPGRKIETQLTDSAYRAIASREGIIESAMLIGDKTGDRKLRKLIASGEKIEGIDRLFNTD
jgi:NAD(P)H-nitrite reductase large subunit